MHSDSVSQFVCFDLKCSDGVFYVVSLNKWIWPWLLDKENKEILERRTYECSSNFFFFHSLSFSNIFNLIKKFVCIRDANVNATRFELIYFDEIWKLFYSNSANSYKFYQIGHFPSFHYLCKINFIFTVCFDYVSTFYQRILHNNRNNCITSSRLSLEVSLNVWHFYYSAPSNWFCV